MSLSIEEMFTFCKKKGFVFQNSEIYGGMSGFFDFGPLGVELSNNIKQHWWRRFVKSRPDVVGIDGSILSHPKVWEASGHVGNFADVMVECKKCHARLRADHLIEDELKIATEGMDATQITKLILKHKLTCPTCKKGELSKPAQFNLMFSTHVGPKQDHESVSYLRPETAQLIFTNFKAVADTSRLRLPFGIAQTGKAFRNEISPREFLFRVREFEQMEIEFFMHPKETKCSMIDKKKLKTEIQFLDVKTQDEKKDTLKKTTFEKMLKDKLLSEWHVYWLCEMYHWYTDLGINPKNLRIREHIKDELSHYSSATFDIDYHFPFGWKEIYGCADRGNYDLTQHQKVSSKKLEFFDEQKKEKVLPQVIEPSMGVGRAFLAFMFDAYEDDKKRGNIALKLHPRLAPIQIGVFPLVKNKPELVKLASEIYEELKDDLLCTYDQAGSVGRRYARADEQGIPFCITVDFESLDDKKVTVRDRDTTEQQRVSISELRVLLLSKIKV